MWYETILIDLLFSFVISMLIGPKGMCWPNDRYLVIWINTLSITDSKSQSVISWICLHNITCVVTQWIAIPFPHFLLNATWSKWNELNKWPFLCHLSRLFIKFRMHVWGNDSMDLITQHHLCCDKANHKTVSNFHLNATWIWRNELNKWPLIGHLRNLVIKFRMQVWVSESMDWLA